MFLNETSSDATIEGFNYNQDIVNIENTPVLPVSNMYLDVLVIADAMRVSAFDIVKNLPRLKNFDFHLGWWDAGFVVGGNAEE